MRTLQDLSVEAKNILAELDSKIKWEVFLFFLHNPGARVSMSTLSSFLCRQAEDVRLAVRGLRECGIFQKGENGVIALSEEQAKLDFIEEVADYIEDKGEKIAGVFLKE